MRPWVFRARPLIIAARFTDTGMIKHCDIVVEPPNTKMIAIAGGNVEDTVMMRHVPVIADGRLAGPGGVTLDKRHPWTVVLRVLEPAASR